MNDNLPELRDIHIPEGVSIFPPAYGWYIILLALITGLILIKIYRIWQQKSRKKYALNVLKSLDNENIIISVALISELLRRICVYRYPQAVALSGEDWLNFIEQHGKTKLSEQNKELLLNAPYMDKQKQVYQLQNLQDIVNFTQAWIGENL